MTIRLILTGGTIDKRYNELNGAISFDDSYIDEMLAQARCSEPIAIERLMMKDSLDMSQADRDSITKACNDSAEQRIVVTHGTDTMTKTARTIARNKNIAHKTIVLTGAMVPYSFGVRSDAQFNLGTAFAFAQSLPAGVYIAMNGRYFKSDNVRKDTAAGLFKGLSET